MKNIKTLIYCFLIAGTVFASCAQEKQRFTITENKAEKRVDITLDGKPFTSYIYPESLMKPVLYPIYTSDGALITRGWPMDPRPGERVDHPHHVGLWFNYGDVNGLDFWNNSTSIPEDKKSGYGLIKHASVNRMVTNDDHAALEVTSYWQKPDGTNLLKEDTKYVFIGNAEKRAIEIFVKLTALEEDIALKDNKEGLLGLRLARELEHPSDKPEKFTDANGIATDVAIMNNEGVTGLYRSSEGKEGDDVWGTRGRWVNLNGKIGDKLVSVAILDNPNNVGYPTFWHARGYGLFAANPLGQKEFSKGEEVLDYKLKSGDSVVFKFKILINSGSHLSDDQVNQSFSDFQSQ